jgi:LacI family transcriptional regulator
MTPAAAHSNKPRGSVSIQDVADAASVSIATVSRVINNPALVSGPTSQRVREAIRELGFRPNHFARGLMTRQSRVLGIALPDIHGEFYSELIRGADTEAHKRGYHLLVSSGARRSKAPGPGHAAETTSGGATLPFGLVDGLALMITEPNDALLREARESGVPLVVLDSDAADVDCILVDNEVGTQEATEHLLKSVAADHCFFVGGPRENFDTIRRAKAFLKTLRAPPHAHSPAPTQTAYGEYSFDWGRRWTEDWLLRGPASHPRPSGVLAGNDEIAYGVMHTLVQHGLNVPEDVRVIGFDDTRLSSFLRPALSTVRVPLAEIGVAAVDTLCRRLESPDAPPARVHLPTALVIRETGRPRAGPP